MDGEMLTNGHNVNHNVNYMQATIVICKQQQGVCKDVHWRCREVLVFSWGGHIS